MFDRVACRKLRHTNIVLFMGACIKDDDVCIVTEYCQNGSLEKLLFDKKVRQWRWRAW